MPSPLAGAIVLSDGESDMDTEEKLPAQSPGLDCSFVIFRVPHHHPHRLKRPLAHSDELVFGDLAIRVYAVASFKEEQGVELKVQRTDTADIHLADLFGFGEKNPPVSANQLLESFHRWTVEPALFVDPGADMVLGLMGH